jgi:Sulfotransferase family
MSGRVGSTLLLQLLATSDEVVVDRVYPFENAYLAFFIHFVEQLGMPYDAARNWNIHALVADIDAEASIKGGPLPFEPISVDRQELRRRAMRKLWEAFSEAAVIRTGGTGRVRFYAEKLIVGVDVRSVMEAHIPVVLIDLVRDPRDVFASIQAFNQARGFPSFGRLAGHSDAEYLDVFVAAEKAQLIGLHRPYHGVTPILVRYEDMVADLGGIATRLGSEIGLSLDHTVVESGRDAFRHHMTSDGGPGSVGRWRHDLSPREIAKIEKELGADMARLGYNV